MRIRKIKDEADARACLAAARAAGGNAVAWARANGVDARSLNAWRVNIGRRRSVRAHALVELVPAGGVGARYVLDVAGARLEFDDLCSAETLQRVVTALRAC